MSKVILFVSAFVPMYALFLLNLVIELINNNLSFNVTNTLVLSALIVLILVGIIGLMVIINSKPLDCLGIKVVTKKNLTDQHFLNYFSLFVLLALTFDLSKICFIFVLIATLVFIGVVYIKNNIFYVNPLLNILGYSFYDITYVDGRGVCGEARIFFKGELVVGEENYDMVKCKRNLIFLKKVINND